MALHQATTITTPLPPASSGATRGRAPSVLRWSTAATLAASAIFHVPVIAPHLHEAPYIGILFIALTVACVALAAALLLRDYPLIRAAAGAVTALAVISYVVSRTIGLPEIGDDIGNWAEPLGVASITAEALTVILAAVAVTHRHPQRCAADTEASR